MSTISAEEVKRRTNSVASTLGSHAMEGLFPDAETLKLLRRYEQGELSLDQLSEAMDAYADTLLAAQRSLAGAA